MKRLPVRVVALFFVLERGTPACWQPVYLPAVALFQDTGSFVLTKKKNQIHLYNFLLIRTFAEH